MSSKKSQKARRKKLRRRQKAVQNHGQNASAKHQSPSGRTGSFQSSRLKDKGGNQ